MQVKSQNIKKSPYQKLSIKINKPPRKHIERTKCKQFISLFDRLQELNIISKEILIFHIANEAPTSKLHRISQYQMGKKAGVPDYLIVMPIIKVAYIEFKADDKCKLSPTQQEFASVCHKYDIPHLVTSDIHKAIDFIKDLWNQSLILRQ